MFKDSKTKPKYSIRKYSVGAASALIGFMTLAHGQVVHADEAQSISDLTNASNQSQAPQTASTAQVATSEPASVETVQASQPANIMPSQPQVTPVQEAEQTPTIDQVVETGTSQNQETSANVLTNATEDQGQGKEYNTDNYGAKMPYTTHEAENATIENGATIQQSTDMESTAVEASNQTYVELPKKDASVTFTVTEPANALNIRYTIPDGASGQLDVQVNGSSVGNIDLSSHSAWQYLKGDQEYDQAIDGSSARFRFDETRLLLKDIQLKAGDKISLVKKKDDNVPCGIDFIELEQAPAPVAQSENSISIVDKGASANDDSDDTAALLAAVEEAKVSGKSVYIPEGRFNFDKQVNIEADNLKISGAGVWHTQLHFTSDKRYGGGIVFGHNSNGIELSNLYMDSNLTSRYKEDAQYKAISGTLGKNSHINNLADGINFAQGTKNSTVKNSNIRGNGDDGLAIWSSISDGTNAAAEENNKFLNNTIESGWRAAGIGIFGGKGHEISGNLIKDVFAGSGIRVNTVFAGHNFDHNDNGIKIHDNTILRSGTTNDLYNLHRGAIDFQQVRGTIKNVDVYDNKLLNTLADPVITKNFEMGDNGNGEIRLSNNTIDNKATIIGNVSAVSPTKPEPKPVNNPVSETSVSETPKSEVSSSAPVSEASTSEVISKTSESETPKSEESSTAPVSEVSTSEVVSETSASETPKSEVSSSAPVSEASTSEVTSETSASETPKSEANSITPVSETSNSEVISETSVSEAPTSEVVSEASTSEVVSETSVTESPKSEASSTAPVSEVSTSEVASETSVSEKPKSEASSTASVSESSTSVVVSETSASETPKSEAGSTAPVSEASTSEVTSETSASETSNSEETSGASSTSQVYIAITSDSPEKASTSESTQKDPISEVSSEVIEKGSTSQIAVKVSEAPTTASTSEVVSISPNSQMAYNDDLKTPVTSSQLTSEAIPYHSLLNAKSVDMIASKVMAVMASETLASEAATLASSEGAIKEINSDLSELVENKKDDKPENVARIDKKTEARQVAKASGSQESTSKEQGKSNTATVLFLVGIGAALSLSTVYLTKHGKKVSK